MKRLAFMLLVMVPSFGTAQEDRGLTLMERGALMFMEGILKEMEPAVEEFSSLADQLAPALKEFAEEMGPKLTTLLEQVEDWSAYEAPEILPNGDIIIRRKAERPLDVPQTPAPQIDL